MQPSPPSPGARAMVIDVDQALRLLAPPQHELDECRAHIEEAFEIMAAATRADKYVGVTKRTRASRNH
jgi:hypothetical protein